VGLTVDKTGHSNKQFCYTNVLNKIRLSIHDKIPDYKRLIYLGQLNSSLTFYPFNFAVTVLMICVSV